MDKQLLADILTAQEAESQRRMTHQPQAPNPYIEGIKGMGTRWWQGVQDRVGELAHGIVNFPEELGQLLDPEYMDTIRKPTFEEGMEVAMDVFNGAPGIVGMFGGTGAKGADYAALKLAEALEKKGVSRDEIVQQTGWFRGPEDKWRFEIPDDKARLLTPQSRGKGFSTAERALSHPELFENYPHLRDLSTQWGTGGPVTSPTGSYSLSAGGDEAIRAAGGTPEQTQSALLHELQHTIQTREGWASGGDAQALSRDEYWRQAGEAEARNVQTRMNWTPEQRRATPPWKSLDIPEDELIVRLARELEKKRKVYLF
jgi:hypothetical protein